MNPEIKKLRERTAAYKKRHPEYAVSVREKPVKQKRKNMKTKRKLIPGTRCTYCGKLLTKQNATFDHIVPIALGGTHDSHNLCWCCRKCNLDKGSKTLEEWKCM